MCPLPMLPLPHSRAQTVSTSPRSVLGRGDIWEERCAEG